MSALVGISLGLIVAIAAALAPSNHTTTSNGSQLRGTLITNDETPPTDRELGADGLTDRVVQMLDLDPATIRAVGSFTPTTGGSHEVYLARTTSGKTCLVEERIFDIPGKVPGIYGGGCDPGPSGPRDLKIAISAQGDPDAPGTRGISIVGVAGVEISRITLTLRDGRKLPVELNDANAFQYSVPPSSAGGAGSPRLFEGLDASGRVVDQTAVR